MDEYRYVIMPYEDRVTLDKASVYEVAAATTKRIPFINKTFDTYLDASQIRIDTDQIDKIKITNIDPKEIINIDGKSFVQLSSTADIARAEINNNRSPYSTLRIIGIDEEKKIKYCEIFSINECEKPILPYLSNYEL